MNAFGVFVSVCLLLIAVYYGRLEWTRREKEAVRRLFERSTSTLDDIKGHAQQFDHKEIVKVNENIYVAVGYALANSIMIIGKDGVIIVDVTESYESAQEIYAEFRKITDKPITDIVYTHNHADHTVGAKAFVENEKKLPDIWAHETIKKGFGLLFHGIREASFARAMRQFGVFLPESVSAGIGFKLNFGQEGHESGFVFPNKFVEGSELDVNLAGLQLKIVHIPGETDDQIGLWLPEHKAFLCADDLYKAFPNLYAIRGTKSRDLLQWVESMDKMIDHEPSMLIPSHTRPVTGRDTVMALLTEYRDAIQLVHDQTVRAAQYGYHPDEIANKVKLSAKLLKNPYLKEFYGTVKWSSKSVFVDYQGWFSGDPVELDPLTRIDKAERMIKLVGADKLVEAARNALTSGDLQWALELSSYVFRLDPRNSNARDIKVEALTELGSRQTSVNGRNYYLTVAMETVTGLKFKTPQSLRAENIDAYPIDFIMSAFPTMFRIEDCEERNETLYFHFNEPTSHYFIQLRNGIAIIKNRIPEQYDIKLLASVQTWKDVVAQRKMAAAALVTGEITLEKGGALALKSFMDCFDKNIQYDDL